MNDGILKGQQIKNAELINRINNHCYHSEYYGLFKV